MRAPARPVAGRERRCDRDPLDLLPAFLDRPDPFLLYSARTGLETGRYSFLGTDPFLRFESRGDRCRIVRRDGSGETRRGDPLVQLGRLLRAYRTAPLAGVPFAGGAVGYFSYSLQWLARGGSPPPSKPQVPPDIDLGFYDRLLVFDHRRGTVRPVVVDFPDEGADDRRDPIEAALADLERRLAVAAPPRPVAAWAAARFLPGVTFPAYERMVRTAQEAIAAGETYQLNLAYRFATDRRPDPVAAFRRLVACSPTPFCAFVVAGPRAILSTSPARFLHWDGCRAESRPIKGTRPRGDDAASDRRLRRELLSSRKDRAENVMIVDLIRNDLGRICRTGSVRVRRLADCETYARVFHLVSTVEGETRPGIEAVDLVRALFPGGSMTGAPKLRSIEWIDRLEPEPRGIYAGCLGYLSFSGGVDLSIVIRTVIVERDGAHFHVGGAILADSDPAAEHRETLAKADAIFRALEGEAVVIDAREANERLGQEGEAGGR